MDAALKEYDTVLKIKVNDAAGFVDAVSLLWRIEVPSIFQVNDHILYMATAVYWH